MTKPHFSAEPSMEDILTSIRKMISEERLGPRPVPDQIGRTPFGDTRQPAAARSGEREPLPDRAPAARSAPSFSSLSDALKTAAPGSTQRLTLEEKIADMLEDGADPDADPAGPADSLAVFAGRSPASAPEPDRINARQSPGTETPPNRMRPVSGVPQAPMNGAASHREPRPAVPAPAKPLPTERPAARRVPTQSRPNGAPAGAPKDLGPKDTGPKDKGPAGAEPRQADTQRIIAMPSRLPPAPGAGAADASPAGPTVNGANVSPLGPRPLPGGPQPARPSTRESDKVMAKVAEKVSDRIAARGPDAPQHGLTKADAPPAAPRAEAHREQPTPQRETPGAFGGAAPATTPNVSEDALKAFVEKAAEGATTSAEPDAAKPSTARAPSEALIDAVVDLVHREPESLSVFTSGSAFIHGVTGDEPHSDKPAVSTRKLDRSASELLRPMLRQWLADNMPRIVEEALRSELMSSQSAETDADET